MTAYRDQYASLFHDGRKVVLLGISNDSPESQASWLKDADFPFVFASDEAHAGATYAKFGGTVRANGFAQSRTVIVVGPDGRVAGVIPKFNQVDPQAYKDLAAIIDRVTPAPTGNGTSP
jgi:peroxiredoxin